MRRDEREVRDRLDALERLSRATDRALGSLSGSVDRRVVVLSGSIDSRISGISGGDTTALSGSINSAIQTLSGSVTGRFNSLSGTIDARFATFQPLDADLTAIAALTGTGLFERTGDGTAALRALGVGAATSVLTRTDGDARYNSISDNRVSAIVWSPGFAGGGQASIRNYGSGTIAAIYMGRAPRTFTSESLQIRYRTTTPLGTGSGGTPWAEVGLATGSVSFGGNSTIVPIASANAMTEMTGAAGAKTTTIANVSVVGGADWWVLCGGNIGASLGQGVQFRGLSVGDDLTTGIFASRALTAGETRPSNGIGSSWVVTIDANNASALWVAIGLP